ncbi:AAA family ATPase [Bacillaceae bacterium SIJ1]|uniref:AAA family ATPase n=1 Tax=Litoribacterium kuwaitense TaxID=1398745 RepID=UPI0013E9C687|nr:AAA family ATPase [Litoribacterium kuwaitense]NGP44586.1 AAA family ATPase [Litoribacterium kuwaitense]
MSLKSLYILHDQIPNTNDYPFSIPAIRRLDELHLDQPVTCFVGENGSGKSTLLEAIADKAGFNTAGGGAGHVYDVHRSEASLGDYIRLSWLPKHTRGFFLRAESFYHFASYIDQDPDLLAMQYGNRSLLSQSHGESFMRMFTEKFSGKSLFLLDEPEAALSPQRQLALLRIMKDLTEEGSQFIIATHSPILLGYPDAVIYNFDAEPVAPIAYEETDHVNITHAFITRRQTLLDELFTEDDES